MIRTLSANWYLDPQIHQLERDKIFAPAWWLVGPLAALSEPGSYICETVSGWPIIIVKGDDQQIRGFKNVCRHRGAAVLEAGCGKLHSIRCPYHGWLYDLDGSLLVTPKFGDEIDAVQSDLGLMEIAVHVWKNLVFCNIMNEPAIGFAEWIGEVDQLCEQFPEPEALEYEGEFTVNGNINWKLYVDNTCEGYHLNLVHPRLGRAVGGQNVRLFSVNGGKSVVFDIQYSARSASSELRSGKGLWVYHFPGLQLVLGDNLFKAERVEAAGVDGLRSRNWAWYSRLSKEEKRDAINWAKTIVEEDIAICSSVYRNMNAGIFESGPLSPNMERHVARIQEIIRDLVGPVR